MFFSLFKISAQELQEQEGSKLIVDLKKIVAGDKILSMPIFKKKYITLSDQNGESAVNKSNQEVFNDRWDTVRFNPYWDTSVSFPFELKFRDENFSSPITRKMVVTSRYGWRRGRPHRGIDIDLQVGDTVKTILDGKVRYVGYYSGFGNTVIVRHYNGLETVYAHLSKILVKENDLVKKGNVIGKGGVSGNARGSHLHLEVRYQGKSINPEYVFEFNEDSEIRSDVVMVTKKWATPRYHRSTRKSTIVVHKTLEDVSLIKEQQQKVYTVKKGDTLYRIANKYGLVISEICKANAIKHNSVLKIGQQIIIN
ncbi:M23 family metallopeptidase [Aquimarina sp. 2201CG1-2-11]|uniref:peptidoglycan DD-metalloendopeptidase family protein n=1 Tax=Aquimarina discodermiae TaxID=3231043 RepID=UPI003462AEC4